MNAKLYYHPFTRAATVVWMLEEVGRPYDVSYVDIQKGEHKSPEMLRLNPMGKLPILDDGDVVVTEVAAIGLYLADRYAPGRLAPAPSAPERGTYLRWSLFAPSVLEPGSLAKTAKWEFRESNAGWGNYEAMLAAVESAIGAGPFLLGEQFTMADVILGSTLRYMMRFKMVDPKPSFEAYTNRLAARPASLASDALVARLAQERGLQWG